MSSYWGVPIWTVIRINGMVFYKFVHYITSNNQKKSDNLNLTQVKKVRFYASFNCTKLLLDILECKKMMCQSQIHKQFMNLISHQSGMTFRNIFDF